MADKKEIKAKAAAAEKALKELMAAFEESSPNTRAEMNGFAKELASKVGDFKKKLTVESRFKVLLRRGRRPSNAKPTAKKPVHVAKKAAVPAAPVPEAPSKKLPKAKKPAMSIPAPRTDALPAMPE